MINLSDFCNVYLFHLRFILSNQSVKKWIYLYNVLFSYQIRINACIFFRIRVGFTCKELFCCHEGTETQNFMTQVIASFIPRIQNQTLSFSFSLNFTYNNCSSYKYQHANNQQKSIFFEYFSSPIAWVYPSLQCLLDNLTTNMFSVHYTCSFPHLSEE